MMSREELLELIKEKGRQDALDLQAKAVAGELTPAEITEHEDKIPVFDAEKDYSNWPIGAPIIKDGQICLLIINPIPATMALEPNKTETPVETKIWYVIHTKNPKKARPWVEGVWMTDECYLSTDGSVKRCLVDGVNGNADEYPDEWETVEIAE